VSAKLDEMWAALEAHKPAPEYAEAWHRMCRERTEASVWAAYDAAPKQAAAKDAAVTVAAAVAWEADTASAAHPVDGWIAADAADHYAQEAIDAIKEGKS
jgi:hypothetical protein